MAKARAYMLPSQKHDWGTPKKFFDEQVWPKYGPFDLDVCGQREAHYATWLIESRGGRFFDGGTEAMDGLVQPWHCERAWMNPPHDKVALWVARAAEQVRIGNVRHSVTALLPVRTDTGWWQDHVMIGMGWCGDVRPGILAVRFLRGRLKFEGACTKCDGSGRLRNHHHCKRCKGTGKTVNGATFPSAIVVWGHA